MVINESMIIGFGTLLITIIIIHVTALVISKCMKGLDTSTHLILKLAWIYPILIVGFIIAMLWTGLVFPPDNHQGIIDTTETQTLPLTQGSNSPTKKSVEIKEESETINKDRMDSLNSFTTDILKDVDTKKENTK